MDKQKLLEISKPFYPLIKNHCMVAVYLINVHDAIVKYYHELSDTIEEDVKQKFEERGFLLTICGNEFSVPAADMFEELVRRSRSEINWKLCKIFDCAYDDYRYKILERDKADEFKLDVRKLLGTKRDLIIPMEIIGGN